MIKYGITWIKVDEIYFAENPTECGIYCGVTAEELESIEYLKKISANKSFWENWEWLQKQVLGL